MDYDVIVVGGGLGGGALARSLAGAGLCVAVLEREARFRDRVRGEQMHGWGVVAARDLGIYEPLLQAGANEARYWKTQIADLPPLPARDLVETSPHGTGSLNMYHPDLQETVIREAEQAGAEVRRSAHTLGVSPGKPPSVRVREGGRERNLTARLVVGADGRSSGCRGWGGFQVRKDPPRMVITGSLWTGMDMPQDTVRLATVPNRGEMFLSAPVGGGRFRCYVACHHQTGAEPPRGPDAAGRFREAAAAAGADPAWFEGASCSGPIGSFEGADTWVDHPYRDGVALLGDAAASNDPCFGCGLSLTLRDVRVLRDQLLASEDCDAAGHAYAEEHDRHYGAIHRLTSWMRWFVYEPGPEAVEWRKQAMPRLAVDRSWLPDLSAMGPEFPSDDSARRRFFGEPAD